MQSWQRQTSLVEEVGLLASLIYLGVDEDTLEVLYTSQFGEFMDELDNALLAYEDDIDKLNFAYVNDNKASFE